MGEHEIECISSNRCSLICPITMERVGLPVRGNTCKHLECFDLRAYCEINSKMRAFNNRWACPVCRSILRPKDLCIDAFVMRILTETGADIEAVIMMPDGSWE